MEKNTLEEQEMIKRYKEEYGIEPIDDSIDYKRIFVIGRYLADDTELINNYKELSTIISCDDYYLSLHTPLATKNIKGTDEEKNLIMKNLINESDVIIAEMSKGSKQEEIYIQQALDANKPVLVITKKDSLISTFIKENVRNVLYYDNIHDIEIDIQKYIKEELDLIYKVNE